MKRTRLVSVTFISLLSVFASRAAFSCELEELWQKCAANSEAIFSARQSLDYYQTAKNTSRVLYPLSLSLSATPNFYQNYEQYSDELEVGSASATLTQTLPGGAKLSAGASYGVSSGYRSWNSTDGYTDKGYSDYFLAQVQYSQSLNPYWLHGTFRNPAKTKLSLAADSGEYNLMQAKKNSYSKVLSLYVQFRRNSRNQLLAEKQAALLKINLESLQKMYSSNSALLTDLWKAEKSLDDAESSLNSYNLKKIEILKSLAELCGDDFEISEEAPFPEEQEPLFATDPFLSNLQTQLQILKSQFLLDKQNSAAVISLSAQFKDTSKLKDDIGLDFKDDTNYLHWSATLSGKINNLYGGEGKLYRKKYETERAKYEKQMLEYQKNRNAEKDYYDKMILSYEENLESAENHEANEKENFEGIKQLYESGQKRQIDVLSAEINYLKQKYTLENLRDALWQAKWHRAQFPE